MSFLLPGPCDECGEPGTKWVVLQTGRVLVDNKDIGQTATFCEKHALPGTCRRVQFRWPKPIQNEPKRLE